MFEGQSPDNYEQKCLCVLVLDVSGSMEGERIAELNKGLQEFRREVLADFTASQRLEVAIITFGTYVQTIQQPAHINHFQMPTLSTHGTTKLVDGVRLAMDLVENRKAWYRETGQNYFRPFIILITDGEPDSDQDLQGLSRDVSAAIEAKNFNFFAVGVGDYNHQKLSQVCNTPPPLKLTGLKFAEFFKWLSNSIGIVTKSKEGDIPALPPVSGWTQIQI